MAVTIDIGDAKDIHPKNKQDVGRRLALCGPGERPTARRRRLLRPALRVDEGRGRQDPPAASTTSAAGWSRQAASRSKGFAIAGEDKKFVWADAKIDGDTVVVCSEKVAEPVAVRYAWADNPDCNLYNKAGLPASPFRTDDWPGVTINNK